MTVGLALRQGTIEAARRLRIAFCLYGANLAGAGLLAIPMAVLLDRSLGRSAAVHGLEATFRFEVLLDFLRTESAALADHFQALGLGALLYVGVCTVLSGGVIDAIRSPLRSPFLPRFLGGCGRFAFRFLRLLPYLGVVLAAVHFLNRGLNRIVLAAFDQSTHEVAAFWAMRGKQGLMVLVLLVVAAIFDLARILTAVEDRAHMIGALLTASGFVARHLGPVLGLYGILLALWLVPFAPYLMVAQAILPASSILALAFAQQALMLLHHWLRVVGIASLLAYYRGATGGASAEPAEERSAAPPGRAAMPASPGPARTLVPGLLLAALAGVAAGPGPAPRPTTQTPRPGVTAPRLAEGAPRPDAAPRPPLSRRVVSYRIDASLDPQRHRVAGRETIVYRNDSRAPMPDLRFHLYPNAFSNTRTVYARGGAWTDRAFEAQVERTTQEGSWGYLKVSSVVGADGRDLTRVATVDETLMTVPLPVSVPPGGSVRVEVVWETQLPRTIHRMGYWGEHHDIMQWFPKLGVFTDGGWKVDPFHHYSEFFADFGTYDVTLTVPERYKVEATGVPAGERDNRDGTRSVSYRAEDVHDFAWIADPNLVVAREVFSEGPYAAAPVEILYVHQPYRGGMAPRILAAVKHGLRYYGERFMPYPYPRLIVDDLPMGLGGGMEYPMLFTVSMAWFHPRFYTAPEEVTLHEFGHQYWYGIVATNEVEEAWLDEGINSYVTRRAMDATLGAPRPGRTVNALFVYGAARVLDQGVALPLGDRALNLSQIVGFKETPFRPSGEGLLGSRLSLYDLDLPGLQEGRLLGSKEGYANVARDDAMTTPSWGFFPGSYSGIVYDKTDMVLETLDRLLGRGVLEETLRIYVQRHRFTHPSGRDFLSTLKETAARIRPDLDLGPAVDQLVRGTGRVDFAVTSLESRELAPARGFLPSPRAGEPPEERLAPPPSAEERPRFETEVIVRRLGEVALPVDLEVRFENGEQRRETWDGKASWKRYIYETGSRARRAVIDPERVYAIDLDVNNNGRTLDRQWRPLARLSLLWLFWIQNYLHLAGSLS